MISGRWLTKNIIMLLAILVIGEVTHAACGGTVRTWTSAGSNNDWTTVGNWAGNNAPDTASEDAVIVAGDTRSQVNQNLTVGCVDIQSGQIQSQNNRTLTITGDYFKNHTAAGVFINANHNNFGFAMAGTAAQTFENVDEIKNLTISNNTSVALTLPFAISRSLVISGSTTTLYVDADLNLISGISDITIPTGTTLRLRSGATLTANANITVNGSLILDDGTTLLMGSGKILSVSSTGLLQVNGSSGNTAKIQANGAGNTFTFNMAGLMSANYFKIDRMSAAGLNITGNLQSMSNGEFHYLPTNGYAITLGAAASIPAAMNNLSFYNDNAVANARNFNASAYNGTATTLNSWAGSIGGATYENDTNNKINWGAQAGTQLVLTNNTASGFPGTTINQSSGDTLFATYSITLNQASSATNITSVTLTMTGSGSSSDVSGIKLYRDQTGVKNCAYNAGTDVQIGTVQYLAGSPPSTTFSINPGDVSTNSDTDRACLHVVSGTTPTAQDAKTLQFSISGTSDLSNSQAYNFSPSSGPPVSGGIATINGSPISVWQGDVDDRWTRGGNWAGAVPNSNRDCNVGVGMNIARMDAGNISCQNAALQTGGTINFVGAANEFAIYGGLTVQSGFNFTNAASGVLAMRGTNNQNLSLGTAFPKDMLVANTGTSPNNVVTVVSNSTVQGNLTVASGVLSVANGVTLTVQGNVTIQSGARLEVVPGGTLSLGNGSVMTVNSGGILKLVGTSSLKSTVSGTSGSSYGVIVNGTIQARYYKFDHMGVNGVSIESGASIDATNYLQDGSFTYPSNNSTTFLKLKRQVPGNTLTNMIFDTNGSAATGTININTTGAGAGTLNITSYSGNLGGVSFDIDPTYLISWSGATNTINLTRELSGPTSVDAGGSYAMGRFGFKQSLAGASYLNTDLTTLTLQLTGNGSSSDITEVRVFSDLDCDSAGGTQIGAGQFTGNPARKTFTLGGGVFTIPADVSSPAKVCIYVEYSIAGGASDQKTVGVSVAASGDMVNSQGYGASGSVSFPVTLGTAATIQGGTSTTWTGVTNTNWFTGTNWTGGVPTSSKNCVIGNVTNKPLINGSGAVCKNMDILASGLVTLVNATSARLDIYGSLNSAGTITQNDGVIRFIDGGTGANQTITTGNTITNLQLEKTGGGTVSIASNSVTINSLVFNTGHTGTFKVPANKILILPNGVNINRGTFELAGSSQLQVGNNQTLTVNGGTFKTTGTHDAYPQNLALKAKMTVQSSGKWNFTATSGTVSLVGFQLDYLGDNGLNIGGTTNLTDLRGGHFTNLSQNYSTMKVMQFNTSSVPSSPSDVEWYWAPNNTPPAPAATYLLGSSTGCGGNTISFNNWWGDFFDPNTSTPDTNTKISQTSCNIVISYANSPVSLLSYAATPYDGEVLLEWVTGSEVDHHGFNVYRSQDYNNGYVQINSDLIRNLYAGSGPQGFYRFEDQSVTNGQVYYYIIEDVASGGVKTRHGPVYAMPLSGLGSISAPGSGVNDGSSDSGADGGNAPGSTPVTNIGIIDLGHGVHILSQTDTGLRIEIIPAALNISASSFGGGYSVVEIPGYAKSLTTGEPELPEKVLLIEVPSYRATAQISQSSIIENSVQSPYAIQAVPEYSMDGAGGLTPTHNPNATVYAANMDYPLSGYLELNSSLKEIGGRKYLELKINPVKFNPVAQTISSLQKAVLDIGLDGSAWSQPSPPANLALSPAAVPGVLRIRIGDAGMHQLNFDDIAAAGLDAYLNGVPTANLRLYEMGYEIPIQILSGDASFNSGDSIRFWAKANKTPESVDSEVVLSAWALGDQLASPLRFASVDVDPSGAPASNYFYTEARKKYEQNLIFLNDRQMGDLVDHFYWKRIAKWTDGRPSYYPEYADFQMDLSDLNSLSSQDVRVRLNIRGRHQFRKNGEHKIEVQMNADPNPVVSKLFEGYYPMGLDILIPSDRFGSGTNNMRLHVGVDQLASLDWALLDIDSFEVFYMADLFAHNGQKELFKVPFDASVGISGFATNQISLYDMSDVSSYASLANAAISTSDGGLTYDLVFSLDSTGNENRGYRILAIEDSLLKSPTGIFLGEGYAKSLKDSNNRADLIVIGNNNFLSSAQRLIDRRRSEGLEVLPVSLDQIYAEYSNGLASVQGIKDFLMTAFSSWAKKPKYIILLGDGTTDPRGVLGGGEKSDLPPVPMLSGDYIDYGSDEWYVTPVGQILPKMALGRIPASNQAELENFIDKILAFEAGAAAPTNKVKTLGFYSDVDSLFEGFSKKADSLASTVHSENKSLTTFHKKYEDFPDVPSFKAAISADFNDGPLVLGFVGHGANDQWADDVYNVADIGALNNSKLPIVLGMNCSTGEFYNPDLSADGFGEALVMNPLGGGIAYWGSSTLTVPETQIRLSQSFYQNMAGKLAAGKVSTRLGDLTLLAKASIASQSSAKDALLSYSLLGDPSMKLPASAYNPAPTSSSKGGGGCGMINVPTEGPRGPLSYLLLLLLPMALLIKLRRQKLNA